jgi:endo-1,4-beta-xylanase
MLPAWLREMPVSFDGGVDLLRSHIHTVTHHYRGKLAAWDVVNEAVESDGSWRDTFFLRTFGPDYVTMAFHWAHEGDPEAKLFYNDFSADEVNPKSTAIYGVLRDLLKQGVPVHGVGLQMHLDLWDPPQPRRVADNIRRFNDLGLEVHITEMDVKINDPATEEDLREEARIYREILEVCLEARNCTAFIAWGVTDRYSWVPEHFPGKGSPLLFDREGRPKPAYYAIREALS